nr:CDP-diacylglycerol-glycerol-3-phosphate 3-phosphatidyltransferase [Ipomoea batatas]
MDRSSTYEPSWADQWDFNSDHSTSSKETKKSRSGNGGMKVKVGEGLVKTKAMAATGIKKAKHGTSVGLQWIKDKYHKTTQKN